MHYVIVICLHIPVRTICSIRYTLGAVKAFTNCVLFVTTMKPFSASGLIATHLVRIWLDGLLKLSRRSSQQGFRPVGCLAGWRPADESLFNYTETTTIAS